MRKLIVILSSLFLMLSCRQNSSESTERENPLLTTWDTPYGVPPFDQIRNTHYLPAFRTAMERQKQEIERIVSSTEEASFSNTIEAFEQTGADLDQVSGVFYPLNSAHTNDSLKEIASTIAPELSAHRDAILLNQDLFSRIKSVKDNEGELNLTLEQKRLLDETYKAFIRAGAHLDESSRTRLSEINQRLAGLSEKFGQNLLAETNDFEYHITDEASLGDLPSSLRQAAKEEAKKRGYDEGWIFTLQRPSINPFLQYSSDREARKALYDGYMMRGNNDNENDNKQILSEMVELRIEKAGLLGYDTHASYVLDNNMASTPERAFDLMEKVWKPALAAAKQERTDMRQLMRKDGVTQEFKGWDWRYYAEKVRKEKYAFDEEALRPYFEVNAVRDGVFGLCQKLFGITFTELTDVPRWHPDQQVFEVKEGNGDLIGLVYLDFFIRDSKRGGAWMNNIREQSNMDDEFVHPIVTTNFNFPAPTENGPSLLSLDEASTLFHEFGHAIHGLFSQVNYPSLAGTNVPRDFVEFPSQVMENWMTEPEVLKMFAKHYETGETIPDELIEKINASGTFNQGFATTEYMAAAYLDMYWHNLSEMTEQDVVGFEEEKMNEIGLIEEIIPRYRSTYFAHIFSGGYSAGYYSYLWSQVLDADAFNAFKETDIFNQEMADKFRKMLSLGGSRPGMDLYREFRGRDPEINPLLERRGFTDANQIKK